MTPPTLRPEFTPEYIWGVRDGIYKVDPNVAGRVIEEIIAEHGSINPKALVRASRPPKAPLHSLFEWSNAKAAEKYREVQGASIIRDLRTILPPSELNPEPVTVRAFINESLSDEDRTETSGPRAYIPFRSALGSGFYLNQMMEAAYRDLQNFERKYSVLRAEARFAPHFQALDGLKDALAPAEKPEEGSDD